MDQGQSRTALAAAHHPGTQYPADIEADSHDFLNCRMTDLVISRRWFPAGRHQTPYFTPISSRDRSNGLVDTRGLRNDMTDARGERRFTAIGQHPLDAA